MSNDAWRRNRYAAISAEEEPWWESTRNLRNLESHPDFQAIAAPGLLLGCLKITTDHINKLFT